MRIPPRRRAAPALTALALLGLSACSMEPTNLSADDTDDQREAVAKRAPVELPPAIQASKTYRCKDNSVVYVDWFAGDKQAGVRKTKDAPETMLKAATPGTEKTAEGGYALTGTVDAPTIDITLPGKDKITCKG